MEHVLNSAVDEIIRVRDNGDIIRIVSHFDADGLTSAAIIMKVMQRIHANFHLSITNRLDENIINKLKNENRELYIFTDIGSSYSDVLNLKNVIVLDHHQPKFEHDIIHVNPLLFGKDECSGSEVTYFLADKFGGNEDLLDLAIIGAVGDCMINYDSKLNKKIIDFAIKSNSIQKKRSIKIFSKCTKPLYKAVSSSFDMNIPGITGNESAAVQFLSDIGILNNDHTRTFSDLTKDEEKTLADSVIIKRIEHNEDNPDSIFEDTYYSNRLKMNASEIAMILNAYGRLKEAHLGVLFCLGIENNYKKILIK